MQKSTLLTGLLFVAVVTSCGPATQTASNESSTNANAGPQPTTSVPPPSAVTPCPGAPPQSDSKIAITTPCDGARVSQRQFVGGTVSDSNAQVWVIIHPMVTSDYWVQPNVTVREGGKWKVLCYFGEPIQEHSGRPYEVMAFVNPKETLREGQQLPSWPGAQSKSQAIEVVRE
jgi:hypothetical protein